MASLRIRTVSSPLPTAILFACIIASTIRLSCARDCTFCIAELKRRQLQMSGTEQPHPYTDSPEHTPAITIIGQVATIYVGDFPVQHPMTASREPILVHWISNVYAEDQNGRPIMMKMLTPTSLRPAVASFTVPAGVTSLTAFAFCNKHGLYAGPTVVYKGSSSTTAGPACMVDQNDMTPAIGLQRASGQEMAQSMVAEMHRRQFTEFNALSPFNEEVSPKHTPQMFVDGPTANVIVGEGAITGIDADVHPMIASSRADAIHYVSSIYVLDEKSEVIAMALKYPDDPAPASLNFTIPSDTNFATAFAFCNKHGLFKGSTLRIYHFRGSEDHLLRANDDKDDSGPFKIPYLGVELPSQKPLFMALAGACSAVSVCICLAACCFCCWWIGKKCPRDSDSSESSQQVSTDAQQLEDTREVVLARPVLLKGRTQGSQNQSDPPKDVLGALSPSRLECAIKIISAVNDSKPSAFKQELPQISPTSGEPKREMSRTWV